MKRFGKAFKSWFKTLLMTPEEQYLSFAVDREDLMRRLENIERGKVRDGFYGDSFTYSRHHH